MFKQGLVPTVVIFILWSGMDFLIHGLMLQSAYQDTASLWRPNDQMHAWLMTAVTLFFSFVVVILYRTLIVPKSLSSGLKYGILLGLGIGIFSGIGPFAYMPIPLHMAATWFTLDFAKLALAGFVVGCMVTEPVTQIGDSKF